MGRGDLWELETAEFEQHRYAQQLGLSNDRRHALPLEISCGDSDVHTAMADLADLIVALDVTPAAIASASRQHGVDLGILMSLFTRDPRS